MARTIERSYRLTCLLTQSGFCSPNNKNHRTQRLETLAHTRQQRTIKPTNKTRKGFSRSGRRRGLFARSPAPPPWTPPSRWRWRTGRGCRTASAAGRGSLVRAGVRNHNHHHQQAETAQHQRKFEENSSSTKNNKKRTRANKRELSESIPCNLKKTTEKGALQQATICPVLVRTEYDMGDGSRESQGEPTQPKQVQRLFRDVKRDRRRR